MATSEARAMDQQTARRNPVLDPPDHSLPSRPPNALARETVLAKVIRRGNALRHFPEYSDDKEVALAAVQNEAEAIRYVHPELRTRDREIALAAVTKRGWNLGYISGHLPYGNLRSSQQGAQESPLLRDREIVLTAVKSSGLALRYAAQEMRDDHNTVLLAVLNNGDAIEYASPRLQNDKELVLTALATSKTKMRNVDPISFSTYESQPSCSPLRFASEALCDDSETMLAAIQSVRASGFDDCYEFSRISTRLRNDRDFIIKAVRISGPKMLYLASDELENDRGVLNAADAYVVPAARQKRTKEVMDASFRMASLKQRDALQKFKCPLGNKQHVMEALKLSNGHEVTTEILTQMPDFLRADRDLFCLAAERGRGVLRYASDDLRDDEELVMKTLMFDEHHAIKYASERLRAKKSIALAAVRIQPQNVSGIPFTLLTDITFLLEVSRQVRFHRLLKYVVGKRALGLGSSTGTLELDGWIDAMVAIQTIYDEALALGAAFYILSQHTPLICRN